MKFIFRIFAAFVVVLGAAEAAELGQIRVWGGPADAELLRAWAEGFHRVQPGMEVKLTLHGPESAMMGVYTGAADLALMGREMRLPAETMAFTWVWRYAPTVIEVANAGLGANRPNGPLRVWANRSNPLTGLTMAQLDAIYGAECKRGGKPVKTWGDLGLNGEWAGRPVHIYGPAIDSVSGLFFRQAVLQGSYKWNPAVKELADDRAVVGAVAGDVDGIGYGAAGSGESGVTAESGVSQRVGPARRSLGEGGDNARHLSIAGVELSEANLVNRRYPLGRVVTVVINRKPDTAIEPKTREFLRYVLSAEGQAAIASHGPCLPLSAEQVAAQLENLQ